MQIKQLPVYYLGHLVETLKEQGIQLDKWFLAQGYSIESLKLPTSQVSTRDFDLIMQQVLQKVDCEHLGLELGKRLQIAHHGAFGLAILNAGTAREIINVVKDYIVIRIPYIEISLLEDKEGLTIFAHDTHWQGQMHRFVIEALTIAMLNLFDALKARNNHLQIAQIQFDYEPPSYLDVYRATIPTKIQFNSAFSGIKVAAEYLDVELNGADETSFQQALYLCDDERNRTRAQLSLAGKVRNLLFQSSGQLMSLDDVADELAMSTRSLHRNLTKEGTSFKQLVEDFRALKAKELLLAHGYTVNEVAEKLDYSDTANFRRAFKRWYGVTPTEFIQESK